MSRRDDVDRKADAIGRGAGRKKAARDDPGPSPLRGIGTFGIFGRSAAVPTFGGAFLGLWLDRAWPRDPSWTIALILGGLVVGLLTAWTRIERVGRK